MTTFLQRGYAAIQARNLPDAVQWLEKALTEQPGDAQAMAWLGQTLCSLGRRAEGTARLRQSGRTLLDKAHLDRDIGRVLEVAQQLQQWGDFPGALELLGPAVEINGTGFRGLQLLAVTLAQLNKKSEALDAGRQALALAPDNTMMQVLLASLEADAGLNGEARRRLETVLNGQPNAREAFRARKEMARVLDKLQEYDQVFPHLHASAQLSASLPEYSQQVGFFRSGTTLTQEVLGVHADVFVADETDFVWAMQRELQHMDGSGDSLPDKLRKLDLAGILRLREFYWKRVRDRFGDSIGERRLVDKFTMNTLELGLINTVFPDARVVFVMRDPRDVCVSCFMQLMVPTPATAHLLSWQGTVDFYGQVMAWWMHIRPRLTMDVIEIRYEDAVAQFEPTYRRVFDFLGLSWEPGVANFHEHAAKKFIASPSRNQVAQPLYAASVARWRHYEPEFAPVADALGPFISAFGYAPF
ncbi:MAG: sulfotransferase [Thiobacillus sp.]|nr:sulfotransferase [Thiobacillus sp.]